MMFFVTALSLIGTFIYFEEKIEKIESYYNNRIDYLENDISILRKTKNEKFLLKPLFDIKGIQNKPDDRKTDDDWDILLKASEIRSLIMKEAVDKASYDVENNYDANPEPQLWRYAEALRYYKIEDLQLTYLVSYQSAYDNAMENKKK